MRVCLVYDCLYPHTIGGAERWLRAVAEAAVDAGHEVTYLTRRQWPQGEDPDVPGVQVVGFPSGDSLYTASGDRLVGPTLRYARQVFGYLVRHRRDFDVVHTENFPYFHLLAARVALAGRRVPVLVDWQELLSPGYLRGYLGGRRGAAASAVQRLCVTATPEALCFSDLTESRLRAAGARRVTRLPGLFPSPADTEPELVPPARLTVAYAGRHVADKRVLLIPDILAAVRRTVPDARATVLGDGPITPALRGRVSALGLDDAVDLPGVVPRAEVETTLRGATCLLLPSGREGYGIVIGEAAAHGTPSVVLAGPDNAAVELVASGRNGVVAADDSVESAAGAVLQVHEAGGELRASTARWYAEEAGRRTMAASVDEVLRRYADLH